MQVVGLKTDLRIQGKIRRSVGKDEGDVIKVDEQQQ